MPWLVIMLAGMVGYLIAEENPFFGTILLVGIMVATVLLFGAPQAGIALVAILGIALAAYLFIIFLPIIIFFSLGIMFFIGIIYAIGHLAK